jgi:excisionase family DNA binding protein
MSTNGDENKLDRQTDNQKTSKRALRGFVSVSEAAKFLGVSPDTLRNWEASGKLIPARTEGGARRYSPAILVEYKKSLKPLPKTSVGLTSVSKAAEELRVSADTIRNWDKKGIIKAERTEGGLRRFTRSEIKRLQAELNINPSQNISNNSTPPYTQTAELKKDIVLTTDKPILKNIQALSSADFANYPGTAVSENPDVPTSRVLRVKPLTAFLSIFLVAFLGAAARLAQIHSSARQ